MEISLKNLILIVLISQGLSSGVIYLNPGCSNFDYEGKCINCSSRFYKDQQGICQPVNPNCDDYNPENGHCVTCYPGFTIIEGACLPEFLFSMFDPYCNKFEGSKCIKCSSGYYFDENDKCVQADPNCKSFEKNKCYECYPGFELKQNKCVTQIKASQDPHCNSFKNGKCVKCSYGFYFNSEDICTKIPDECKRFSEENEKCVECYDGYELDSDDKCIKKKEEVSDPNCNEFKNGKCLKCSYGFYFNDEDICTHIPDECLDFRIEQKKCYSCYSGYELDEHNKCVVKVEEVSDPYCNTFKNGVCEKCSYGYYFNKDKKCTEVPVECKNYDTKSQKCFQCYEGYEINQFNYCVHQVSEVSDPNCNQFEHGKCIRCSYGFYFDKKGECKQTPSSCRKFNQEEQTCELCYDGYEIKKSECVLTPKSVTKLYCKKIQEGVCKECASLSVLLPDNTCKLVDPLCKTYDKSNGDCTSCFGGYDLEDGVCIEEKQSEIDPFCKSFKDDVCIQCSYRYFKNEQGKCQHVNPLCDQYDEQNGQCQSCFIGFKLENQKCIKDETVLNDENCARWVDGFCSQCSKGSYFHESGKCKLVDINCKTYDETDGGCLSCYTAYKLEDKKCIEDHGFASQDPFCKQFSDGVCLQCSEGYYFGLDGACTKVSDLCKTYNSQNGHCLSCFTGFKLQNDDGKCIEDQESLTDLNCAKFVDGVCTKCSKGFYFDSDHMCQVANPLCKQFNENDGKCTKCFDGFKLQEGNCEIKEEDSNADPNCAEWMDNMCLRCSARAYFDSDGKCQLVDKDCKTFNKLDGSCLTCYIGFKLNNTKCIRDKQQSSCIEKDENGKCIKCAYKYYLNDDHKCIQVDDQCAEFDYVKRQCKGCYSGYSLLYGKCEITKVEDGKEIQNCFAYTAEGSCLECFERFYLETPSICSQVDVFCKTYDKQNGNCKSCYYGLGFELVGGKCKKQ